MRRTYGALGTMKKLFVSGNLESGLEGCLTHGIEQWSFEWAALNLFADELTAQELEAARFKLNAVKAQLKEKGRRKKWPRAGTAT